MNLVPDWAPNIHPLLVHFPIAWWIGAVLFDLIGLMLPRAIWASTTASVLYPAGALSAAATFLTGRQAAAAVHIPGMAHPVVLEHWNWALGTTAGFALIALARVWLELARPQSARSGRKVLAVVALAALVALFETGERGARLVFEYGVGVAAPRADR
jgi:uncharacterized membrane protein